MNRKSGSSAPPAFKNLRKVSFDVIRNEVKHFKRCVCCLVTIMRKSGSQRSREFSLKDSAFAFHIAAYSLAREDNNPWPGETAQQNRFNDFHNFCVCDRCHMFASRNYKYDTFSVENSLKFFYLQNHITSRIQFGSAVSQRVANEIRGDSDQATSGVQENTGASNVSIADEHDLHHPSSPGSSIEEIEDINDAFFHFGLADDGQDPEHDSEPDLDPDYQPDEQADVDAFEEASRPTNQTCPAYWSPHADKKYGSFSQLIAGNDFTDVSYVPRQFLMKIIDRS